MSGRGTSVRRRGKTPRGAGSRPRRWPWRTSSTCSGAAATSSSRLSRCRSTCRRGATGSANCPSEDSTRGGDPLEAGGKQVKGKKKTVVDGPFAEAKDLVGGYLLVTAENLDDAAELARGCPILEVEGSVEVRPIRKM